MHLIGGEGLKGSIHRGESVKDVLHTWEKAWFPAHSCTTSDQQWGRPGQPPGGSSHLYPPDMPVLVSWQKLPRQTIATIDNKTLFKKKKKSQSMANITALPSLFFSSFGIFFILRSRPLRSVIPYVKAIFSYSSGRAFRRISHTSTSGVSSCCLGSLAIEIREMLWRWRTQTGHCVLRNCSFVSRREDIPKA